MRRVDAFELDQAVERAVAAFPVALRPWLLEVLTSSAEDRARAIGELCAGGEVPALAELLMDMEEDAAGEQVRAMERTTGFEPATPTLARWCSTN